jgi:YD repeat-containing protein
MPTRAAEGVPEEAEKDFPVQDGGDAKAVYAEVLKLYNDNTTPFEQDIAGVNAELRANGFPDIEIVELEDDGLVEFRDKTGQAYSIDESGNVDKKEGIKVDEKGRVTEVDYGNGNKQQFGYDQNGNLNKVVDGSGNTWNLGEDGKWHAKVGGQDVTSDATVYVDDDGTYVITNKDGSVESYRQDGSSSTRYADNSVIERNTAGQVSEIRSATGQVTKVEWSGTGEDAVVTSVELDGQKITYSNGKYISSDGRTYQSVVVDKNGTVTLGDDKGSTEIRADGSAVFQSKDGKTTYVWYTGYQNNSNSLSDEWLTDNEYRSADSGTWNKRDDGSWENEETGQTVKDIHADSEGNIIITDNNGNKTYKYSDGTQTTVRADGVTYSQNRNGIVTEVTAGDTTWQKGGDHGEKWIEMKNGKPTGQQAASAPEVDSNGNIVIRTTDGKVVSYSSSHTAAPGPSRRQ